MSRWHTPEIPICALVEDVMGVCPELSLGVGGLGDMKRDAEPYFNAHGSKAVAMRN